MTGAEGPVLYGILSHYAVVALGRAGGALRDYVFRSDPAVSGAIEKTTAAIPDLDEAPEALGGWVHSEGFADLLEDLYLGRSLPTIDAVLDSFTRHCGFIPSDKLAPRMEDVLVLFLGFLREELLRGDDGTVVLGNRMEELHEETRRYVIEALNETVRVSPPLLSQASAPMSEPGSASPSTPLEQKVNAQTDIARDLIRGLKPHAALEVLVALREEVSTEQVSAQLRCSLATNFGAAYLTLNRLDEARQEFVLANGIDPTDRKATTNLALVRLLDDDPQAALDLIEPVFVEVPDDAYAASIVIRALDRLQREHDLDTFLTDQPWVRTNPETAFHLVQIQERCGQIDEAIALCRSLAREEPDSYVIHSQLGELLLVKVESSRVIGSTYSEEELLLVTQADKELTRVIELLEGTELTGARLSAFAQRAGARWMLGHFEEALKDCDFVLVQEPEHEVAIWNKGVLLASSGDTSARDFLSRVKHPEAADAVLLPLAHAHLQAGQPDLCIELLRPRAEGVSLSNLRELGLIELLAEAEVRTGGSVATDVVRKAHDERPSDSIVLAALSGLARSRGDDEQAEEYLEEAILYADEDSKTGMKLRLANVLFDLGKWSEAAEVFSGLLDGVAYSPLQTRFLICLMNSGSYAQALDLCQVMRNTHNPLPGLVLEAEMKIYEYVGDLEHAIDLQRLVFEHTGRNASEAARLARLLYRHNEQAEAADLVNRFEPGDLKDDYSSLMAIAQVKALLGQDDFLQFAYQARRYGHRSPEMHLDYIGLFHALESTWSEPTQVTGDCAVRLHHERKEDRWIIVGDPELPNEFGTESDLGQRLLGKHSGDTVVLREGLESLSYEINLVQSKYLRAFQESFEDFSTLFPDHPGLSTVDVSNNDFSKMLYMVDQKYELGKRANEYYESGQIPISTFAQILGASTIEAWYGRTGSEAVGAIVMSDGASQSIQAAITALRDATKAVIDMTGLLTISLLELKEPIRARFDEVMVPQQVRDELQELLFGTVSLGKASSVITKQPDGTYSMVDISDEAQEHWKALLDDVGGLIDSFHVVGVGEALNYSRETLGRLQDTVGESALSSVLVASSGIVLISDDLALRKLAKAEFGVASAWSQPLLDDLKERGLLDEREHADSIGKLASANYRFISLSPEVAFSMLEGSDFSLTSPILKSLQQIRAPDCSEESAVRFAAGLIARVWNSPILPSQKGVILDLLLSHLYEGRNLRRVEDQMDDLISSLLALSPARDALLLSIHMRAEVRRSPFRFSGLLRNT